MKQFTVTFQGSGEYFPSPAIINATHFEITSVGALVFLDRSSATLIAAYAPGVWESAREVEA